MDRPSGVDFKHTTLSGSDTFRTIILCPAAGAGFFIECELITSDLSSTADYEALSYVWGDDFVPKYIKLDDKVLQVTSNLYEALLVLQLPSKPRHLWIDAICINQHDVKERNQQVTLMGDIYMKASQVVIWLGQAGEDSHLVYQHIASNKQQRQDMKSSHAFRSHVDWAPRHYYEGPTFVAFQRLCRRPWFFRTWVIQEKALSKEAVVYCGSDSATWGDFFGSADSGKAYHPVRGVDYKSRAHQLREMSPSNKPAAYQKVLSYSQFCQATDSKDKVFGILGLLKPGLFKVEYELDVEEIYCNFAQAIIEENRNIHILNLFGTTHTLSGLPSWVPDFSSRRLSCPLPNPLKGCHSIERFDWLDRYLEKALPGFTFCNSGKELMIKGKAVDALQAVGDEMVPSTEYAIDTAAFSRVFLGWESLAAGSVPRKSSESGPETADHRKTVSEAFLCTLLANDVVIQDKTDFRRVLRMGGVIWYKQHGSGALIEKEPRYFEDVEYCSEFIYYNKHGDLNESSLRRAYESGYQWYTRELELVIYGRKLFVTEGGSLGLADPRVHSGDQIVFLTGSYCPVFLRPGPGNTFTLLGDCYIYNLDIFTIFDDPEKPFVDYNLS